MKQNDSAATHLVLGAEVVCAHEYGESEYVELRLALRASVIGVSPLHVGEGLQVSGQATGSHSFVEGAVSCYHLPNSVGRPHPSTCLLCEEAE